MVNRDGGTHWKRKGTHGESTVNARGNARILKETHREYKVLPTRKRVEEPTGDTAEGRTECTRNSLGAGNAWREKHRCTQAVLC